MVMLTYKTGVNGLDEMLKGGIPAKSITTLIGPAGSGKTIMSLQFLYNNLADGKMCIYVSSSHSRKELVENSLAFGWDFMPYLENRQLIMMKFDPVKIKVKDSEIHLISGFLDELPEFLYSHKADVVVIDSITEFLMLCRSDIERRGRLLNLFSVMKENQNLVWITSETEVNSTHSKYGIVEFVADGIITLRRIQSEDLAELLHVIQINKMRWIKHSREIRQYDITATGIEVYNKYQVMI
jgi:KaiC/GvpD/RAD55 family RecA-like ATPase